MLLRTVFWILCSGLMLLFAKPQKRWHFIHRIASTTNNLFCFADSKDPPPPPPHTQTDIRLFIYIVQSNQPQLQVSVKEGDILFSSRGKRALQFQRSCYLPSINVSSLNQNIIPQKPFTYVGHYLVSHTSLCFINLYNQILLEQIQTSLKCARALFGCRFWSCSALHVHPRKSKNLTSGWMKQEVFADVVQCLWLLLVWFLFVWFPHCLWTTNKKANKQAGSQRQINGLIDIERQTNRQTDSLLAYY